MSHDDSLVKLDMFIESQLEYPQRVSDEIEDKLSTEKYKIMSGIFKTVQHFLNGHKAVLYGGLAINQLLPKHLQFYDKNTLPDFDCFVDKANEKSIELADILVKKGYMYTEVKHAIHEGTFKVFSNFESVADITSLNAIENKLMLANAQITMFEDEPVMVASTHYLKAMAYKELALPVSAHFRWTKVLQRLLRLEYSIPHADNGVDVDTIYVSKLLHKAHSPVYNLLKQYVLDNELVLVGSQSIAKFLQLDVLKRKANSMSVLSNHPSKHVNEMTALIESNEYVVDIRVTDTVENFLPIEYALYGRHVKSNGRYVKLITVYDSTKHCFGYYKHGHHRYSSLYFEMYMLYIRVFMKDGNIEENNKLLFMLGKIMFDDEHRSQTIKQFGTKCYGVGNDILHVRKSIWDNKKKMLFYRPKTN